MPELPEVETMVRGLRPALQGRTIEQTRVHDPFLLQGCDAREFARRGRRVQVVGGGAPGKVGRDHARRSPGNDRHPAPDDWRLLARRAASTRAHPPVVSTGETRGDGLVLRHAAAGQDPLVRQPRGRGRAFARSHGPDALEIALRRPGRAASPDEPRASSRPSWTRRSSRASATSTPTRSSSPLGSTPSARPSR